MQNLFGEFLHQEDVAGHRKVRLEHRDAGGGKGVFELLSNSMANRCYGLLNTLQFARPIADRLGVLVRGQGHSLQDDDTAMADTPA